MSDGWIIIGAGRAERHYWLELWRYRELFRVLAWRDLSARYKQNGYWCAVGAYSSRAHHASLDGRLQPHCGVALGW